MAGYSVEESSYRSNYINKYDYPTDLIPTLNQATTILNSQNDARTNRSGETMIGSFGRAMYNYAGKYYITGSIRRDGSSRFGQDNKWGVFPSLSFAWRLSDEFFFEPFRKYISDLKIRGGWGVIGNAGISNYLALSTLNSTSYVLGQGSTVSAAYVDGKVANSKLGWETTTDYSIGSDIQLLNSRINLSIDYFNRETTDMLFNMPLPTITGFGSYMANIGAMRNRGFEYSLSTKNLVGSLKWTTDLNLSYYRNRVLDIGKDKRPLIIDNCYTTEGKPLAGLWGKVDLGPYKDWEDVKTSPISKANNPLWRNRSNPGTPKAADVNGDGIIDGSDNTIIGSSIPDFVWGMTNSFAYKGFDLSVQVNGVQGGDINMLEYTGIFGRGAGLMNTTTDYYNNYWRPDRTDAKYPAPTRKNYDGSDLSGMLVYDGSYINIQNISFGYTLPKHLIKRASFSNVRVYTSVQNAFFITEFPGFNPETNYRGDQTTSQGIDRGAYPLSRTISFGLNISM
jgi:TonB-linked SusC/RagA family outer membrane protein